MVPGPASDLDHRLCPPPVLGRDWQRVLESERELPIALETLCQAWEAETWDHDFQIRGLEFRIAWQIGRRLLKTDGAT